MGEPQSWLGIPSLSSGTTGLGYFPVQDRTGVLTLSQDRTRVPWPGQDWGTTPARAGLGYPPSQESGVSTCYVAGGMSLAVMQKDFLVTYQLLSMTGRLSFDMCLYSCLSTPRGTLARSQTGGTQARSSWGIPLLGGTPSQTWPGGTLLRVPHLRYPHQTWLGVPCWGYPAGGTPSQEPHLPHQTWLGGILLGHTPPWVPPCWVWPGEYPAGGTL